LFFSTAAERSLFNAPAALKFKLRMQQSVRGKHQLKEAPFDDELTERGSVVISDMTYTVEE
jgi:hypothetical protein